MKIKDLKTKLEKEKLTRADVYELVNQHRNVNRDKKWRESVKFDLEDLGSVVESGVLNKVLKDLDSYDH
jgi:hypothetical protein